MKLRNEQKEKICTLYTSLEREKQIGLEMSDRRTVLFTGIIYEWYSIENYNISSTYELSKTVVSSSPFFFCKRARKTR